MYLFASIVFFCLLPWLLPFRTSPFLPSFPFSLTTLSDQFGKPVMKAQVRSGQCSLARCYGGVIVITILIISINVILLYWYYIHTSIHSHYPSPSLSSDYFSHHSLLCSSRVQTNICHAPVKLELKFFHPISSPNISIPPRIITSLLIIIIIVSHHHCHHHHLFLHSLIGSWLSLLLFYILP